MERFSFILVTAGILSFVFAFIVMAILPWATYKDEPIKSIAQLAEDVPYEFHKLQRDYPDAFAKHFGEVNSGTFEEALRLGHKVYVAEGCWHCHSQQIRPVSNEDVRWGPVSYPEEYQNRLQMPVMFGTRRIGPDLIRENGRRSNDWHMAHFYRPVDVVPDSVMPNYPWFYEDENTPGKKALAIVAYVQWLGSWVEGDRAQREADLVALAEKEGAEAGISSRQAAPAVEEPAAQAKPAEAAAPESDEDAWGEEPEAEASDEWGDEWGDAEETAAPAPAATTQEAEDEEW